MQDQHEIHESPMNAGWLLFSDLGQGSISGPWDNMGISVVNLTNFYLENLHKNDL